MRVGRCPQTQELEQLFLGGLSEEGVRTQEEHVLTCASCLETLKALAGTRDTLAGLLGEKVDGEPFSPSPVVADLMQQLKTLRVGGKEPPAGSLGARPSSPCVQPENIAGSTCPSCHFKSGSNTRFLSVSTLVSSVTRVGGRKSTFSRLIVSVDIAGLSRVRFDDGD